MTQGVMTPYPPSSPSTASLSGAARCWHSNALIFRYFLRYFSSTHRTDLSRFRGTFHSFDPVGFAIFAILRASGGLPLGLLLTKSDNALSVAFISHAISFRGPETSIGNNVQRAGNNSPPRSRRRIGLEL